MPTSASDRRAPVISLNERQPSLAAVRAFSTVPRTRVSSLMKSSSFGSICRAPDGPVGQVQPALDSTGHRTE